jgi:cytochrome c oxidase assembly factor CtaG
VLSAHARWFVLAWLVLAAAVLSPLHEAGQRSFTAHMIEHEIIMMVAAPLFALSRPLPTMLWGLAQPWRRLVGALAAWSAPGWRALGAPLTSTMLQAAALWLWHAPALFNLALQSEFWHAAQHMSFFLTALLFWASMLDRRRDIGARVLCLFATSLISGALGALMAVSSSPWYAPYAELGMTLSGLTPEQDQQLAGALMWVPGGLLHAAAAVALLAPWLRSEPPRKVADA